MRTKNGTKALKLIIGISILTTASQWVDADTIGYWRFEQRLPTNGSWHVWCWPDSSTNNTPTYGTANCTTSLPPSTKAFCQTDNGTTSPESVALIRTRCKHCNCLLTVSPSHKAERNPFRRDHSATARSCG